MAISFLLGEILRVIVLSNEYYYDDHCVGGRSPNWTVTNLCSPNPLDAPDICKSVVGENTYLL